MTEILISVAIFLQAITLYFVLKILRGEKQMSAEFDALVAQVAQQTTVEQSAITLIQGLAAQIAALGSAPTPAQITALTQSLNASATSLAAAVAQNTQAQNAPTS